MVDKVRRPAFRAYRSSGSTKAEFQRARILKGVKRELRATPDDALVRINDAPQAGVRMVRIALRTPSKMAEIVGDVYSTQGLEEMWGVTRAAVSKKVSQGKLLAVKAGNQNFFPVFQFDGKRVRDEVIDVVRILSAEADPWTVALWLTAPHRGDPKNRTNIAMLEDGEQEQVLTSARETAHRWAS